MDSHRCLIGIVICLAVLVLSGFMIYALESLRRYTADEEEENAEFLKYTDDKMYVRERMSVLKITTAVFEMACFQYFFSGFFSEIAYKITSMPKYVTKFAAFIIAALIVCILTSSLCSMLPRKLACKRETKSNATYKFGIFAYHFIAPVWWIQFGIGTLTSLLFKADIHNDDEKVTEEKILQLVDEGNETGVIKESQREMINNIFDFDETLVSDVMTHRKDMVAMSEDTVLSEAVRISSREGYSRIPIYKENIDKITGVIYVKDLISIIGDKVNQDVPAKKFKRDVMFVPETAKCSDVLRTMLKNKTQIAIVADEYGGTFGLVCMEDLIEEIVGNIQDEYDNEEAEITKIDDNVYVVAGDARLEETFSELDIKMPEEDKYDTVGCFVVDMLGYVPENHTCPTAEYENCIFEALEVKDNWIEKVKITINNKTEEEK